MPGRRAAESIQDTHPSRASHSARKPRFEAAWRHQPPREASPRPEAGPHRLTTWQATIPKPEVFAWSCSPCCGQDWRETRSVAAIATPSEMPVHTGAQCVGVELVLTLRKRGDADGLRRERLGAVIVIEIFEPHRGLWRDAIINAGADRPADACVVPCRRYAGAVVDGFVLNARQRETSRHENQRPIEPVSEAAAHMAVPIDRSLQLRDRRIGRQARIDGGLCGDEAEIAFETADDTAPLHGGACHDAAGEPRRIDEVKFVGAGKRGHPTAGEIARLHTDIGSGPARHHGRRWLPLQRRGRRPEIGRKTRRQAGQARNPHYRNRSFHNRCPPSATALYAPHRSTTVRVRLSLAGSGHFSQQSPELPRQRRGARVSANTESRRCSARFRVWSFGSSPMRNRIGNDGGCILTKTGRGLIAAPMINAATMSIVRRRRTVAVWADICV